LPIAVRAQAAKFRIYARARTSLDKRLYRPDVSSIEDPYERLVGLPADLLFIDREKFPILHHQRAVDDDGADCASMRREGEMGIELVAVPGDERCEAHV